ncbi:MAG: hypothetical protein L7U72_08535, partial [Rubripirellula sp.]|nr:hypothetical protein [Rubripirellula sp.]
MIRTTRPTLRNAADRMKDSMCSPTGRSMDRHWINNQRNADQRLGSVIVIVTALLSLTGCVGPTKRLTSLSDQSTMLGAGNGLATDQQGNVLGNNQATFGEASSLQPETSPVDQAAQVSAPSLPTSNSSIDGLSGYDLSQPVDPQPILQQMNHQAAVGSAVTSSSTESPYYTKPTPVSRTDVNAPPESVYQLLEGLEPGNPPAANDGRVDDATLTQPYVARQFPQTGQPIAVSPQTATP